MRTFLAQAQAAAAATAAPASLHWSTWQPTSSELMAAGGMLAGTLLAGLILLILSRRLLVRLRLRLPLILGIFALAIYLAAWGLKVDRMLDPQDLLAHWVHRLFAAFMIYVLLALVDRLVVVPLLTRRGRVRMPRFIHQIVAITLAVFAILIYGSIAFEWDIDKFLAGSAVVSIVLGLALQETLGNFFSGLVMQASPPFAIGHRIVCGTHEGEVVDMTWRAITLHTDDDNYVMIPNANVAKSEVVNFNVPSRATARFARVGLEYDLPPADAIATLKAAALESEGVLPSPEPIVYLEKFGDSSVEYAVKFWIDDAGQHEIVQHRVSVHIWYRLRERGYNIPFPIRTVEHTSQSQKARQFQAAARGHRLAAIDRVPLLLPLSADQKRQLADSASELYLTTGQVLFRQGDAGDSFYVIYKGNVDVLVQPEGTQDQRLVASLGPGDFFGEMSALTGQPRTATIRAATPVSCVVIEKQDLLPIFQSDPGIMEKISAVVAKRNAEREAVLQDAGATPPAEAVVRQQKTLLGRMINFFRLGNAA